MSSIVLESGEVLRIPKDKGTNMVVDFAALGDISAYASGSTYVDVPVASFDVGSDTVAADKRVLVFAGSPVGIFGLSAGSDGTHWNLSRSTDLASDAQCGTRTVLVTNGGYFKGKSFAQTGATLSALAYTIEGAVVYAAERTALSAASGTATLITIPIATHTDYDVTVAWNCYDGSTGRVQGLEKIHVTRGTGSPTATTPVFAADFVDNTTTRTTPWAPTVGLSGNDLLVQLTADHDNDLIPEVSAYVTSTDTSDAPATNPVPPLRAALHALSPAIELYADVGLTVTADSPPHVTGWADQSGNGHNGTVTGTGTMTYVPDAGGYAAIKTPSSATLTGWGCGTLAGSPHGMTIAWRAVLGDSVGAAVEVIFADNTRWLACNSATGKITYNDGSTSHELGNALAGKHDFVVVINGTGTTATLYTDGIAGAPITVADVAWGGTGSWVSCLGSGGGFGLRSANLHAVCVWFDATNSAARVAAFDAFSVAAFGAHA